MAVRLTPSGFQSYDPLQDFPKKRRATGGTTEKPKPKPKPKKDFPDVEGRVFTEADTGKPIGVTIGGKTFLGLDRREIEAMTGRRQLPAGTISTPEAKEIVKEAEREEEARAFLEREEVFERGPPERIELGEKRVTGERIPVRRQVSPLHPQWQSCPPPRQQKNRHHTCFCHCLLL